MARTPDEILADFDAAFLGETDVSLSNMRDLLWEIIEDVNNSWMLAVQAHSPLTAYLAKQTVNDYLANHYGDD